MEIVSFTSFGYEGLCVSIDVDIRRGIPGVDIVGLPDSAVRESRERVRIALKRSGFDFPMDRILINMAPAGIKKEGAVHDLPMAAAILQKTGQLDSSGEIGRVMLMGELHLNGEVRPVNGAIAAVMTGLENGVDKFVLPVRNIDEVRTLCGDDIYGIGHIRELQTVLGMIASSVPQNISGLPVTDTADGEAPPDFSDMIGQGVMKRALEIAAAGRHNILLFGPPGSGKTMAAQRFPSIFPELDRNESLEVTRIWSLAGKMLKTRGIIRKPVLRTPHHSASLEGLVGGGPGVQPGEASLAHKGILFLDETPEFSPRILQGLREPMETKVVSIVRAGQRYWFPADFQLLMTANPCPCGNLGREEGICICSRQDIFRYWKRIGGALLDRIDIRVPVAPLPPDGIWQKKTEPSLIIKERVERAVRIQKERYAEYPFNRNSRLPPGLVPEFCSLDESTTKIFAGAMKKLGLSSRACHSVLKIARTAADLEGSERIRKKHLLEALQHRRFGDRDIFWNRY